MAESWWPRYPPAAIVIGRPGATAGNPLTWRCIPVRDPVPRSGQAARPPRVRWPPAPQRAPRSSHCAPVPLPRRRAATRGLRHGRRSRDRTPRTSRCPWLPTGYATCVPENLAVQLHGDEIILAAMPRIVCHQLRHGAHSVPSLPGASFGARCCSGQASICQHLDTMPMRTAGASAAASTARPESGRGIPSACRAHP